MWDREQVRERLEALRAADPKFERFGAVAHRYRLRPRLTDAQIEAFEQQHEIELPVDYRSFVGEVGDGGAGPFYGMLPLATARGRDSEDAKELPLLAQTFPHEREWNLEGPWQPLPDESDEAHRERLDAFEEFYSRPEHIAGSLAIAHFGCGDMIRLVVTGQQRGRLWQDGRPGDYGVWPLNTSFGQWYTTWLAEPTDDALP